MVSFLGGFGGSVPIQLADLQVDMADLEGVDPKIGQAMRANVLIQTRQGLARGIGSGVILQIVSGEALVLTNRHVVDATFRPGDNDAPPNVNEVAQVEVKLIDQTIEHGRVTWLAPDDIDLALIRMPLNTVEAVAARWKQRVRATVGDPVFAIGNPQELGWTHTQGSVSQLRTWSIGGRNLRFIQTSAPINPGNSGGGLYDKNGFLIGINTLTSADKRAGEGLGFAIAFEEFLGLRPPGVIEEGAEGLRGQGAKGQKDSAPLDPLAPRPLDPSLPGVER
jgi:serine protease Do